MGGQHSDMMNSFLDHQNYFAVRASGNSFHHDKSARFFTRLNSVGEESKSSSVLSKPSPQTNMDQDLVADSYRGCGLHYYSNSQKQRSNSFNYSGIPRSTPDTSQCLKTSILKPFSFPGNVCKIQNIANRANCKVKATRSWSTSAIDTQLGQLTQQLMMNKSFKPNFLGLTKSLMMINCLEFNEANWPNTGHNSSPQVKEKTSLNVSAEKIPPEVKNSSHCETSLLSSQNYSIMEPSYREDGALPGCKPEKNEVNVNEERNSFSRDSLPKGTDLSSVLYSPRKTCKKGRPSSKKQKKRQREKQKQTLSMQLKIYHKEIPKHEHEGQDTDLEDSSTVNCDSSTNSSLSVMTSNGTPCLSPKQSTPVKHVSPCAPVFSLFRSSSSSDTDDSSEDESNDDSDSDWSLIDVPERDCVPAAVPSGFSIALNLDSIFKQKSIPSLKSLLPDSEEEETDSDDISSVKPNTIHLSLSVSLSDAEDLDDSVAFEVVASPSNTHDHLLADGLQHELHCQAACLQPQDSEHESTDESYMSLLDLPGVNAVWEEAYSGQDACTCCNLKATDGPALKVRFEEGPKLSTTFIVGNEDRAGVWHHYALDRERFQQRIKQASEVISPILNAEHREVVKARNRALSQQT